MAVATDDTSKFRDYAHPERLVSTDWLAGQLAAGDPDGNRDLVVIESDEDVLLYDTGHIPGAVKVDWHIDLNDPVRRDYVNSERFAQVLGERGIGRDTTVVIYGDKSNWWAAYALWVFTLFGHPDARLLDGGRAKWVAEGREVTRDVPDQGDRGLPGRRARRRSDPRVQGRGPGPHRPAHGRRPLPRRVLRRAAAHARLPAGGRAARRPHPRRPVGAVGPRSRRGRHLQDRADLEAIYLIEQGLSPSDDVVAYCRIGERSSHTWFVLTHLLGFEKVRNYDGSWTEWGNAVGMPIEVGAR